MMYVYLHLTININIYVVLLCIYMYICITYMSKCTYIQYMYICICGDMYVHIYTYIYMYMDTYRHNKCVSVYTHIERAMLQNNKIILLLTLSCVCRLFRMYMSIYVYVCVDTSMLIKGYINLVLNYGWDLMSTISCLGLTQRNIDIA
jgi:hypothetical protein